MNKFIFRRIFMIIIFILFVLIVGCDHEEEPIVLDVPDVFLNDNILTWEQVDFAIQYLVNVDGDEYLVSTNSFSLEFLDTPKTYTIKVKSMADNLRYLSSEWSSDIFFVVEIKEPKEYIITFNKRGGLDGSDSVTIKNGESLPVALAPNKDGYLFLGYYDALNGGNQYYDQNMIGQILFNETKDITLYAKWQEITYLITFDKDNGYGGSNSAIVSKGSPLPVILAPSKDGYLFLGYYDAEGIQFYNENVIALIPFNETKDITLYAKWQAIEYKISFDKQSGVGGSDFVFVRISEDLPQALAPSKDGYLFLGYYNEEGIQFYDENMSALIPFEIASDVTLYARWSVLGFLYEIVGNEIVITNSLGNPVNLIIPEEINSLKVVKIASRAFYNCLSLKNVILPNNLKEIEKEAFYGCSNLESIDIKDNVEKIEDHAFFNCVALTTFVLPSKLKQIADFTFYGCLNLEEILFNDNIVKIGAYAFHGCSSLTSLEINKNIEIIDEGAFSYCSKLTEITILSNLVTISNYLFNGCTNLENLILPQTVNLIGQYAFSSCTKLETINIPLALEEIDDYAFYDCISLNQIQFSNNIVKIGAYAFFQCYQFENLVLPNCLEIIDEGAFYNCINLEEVIFSDQIRQINDLAFYNCALLEVTLFFGLIHLGAGVFSECENLNTIILPESIQEISESLFYNCQSLADITLFGSILSIGEYAFYNCLLLSTIDIPDSVNNIGFGAFMGCSSLDSISLPFLGESLDDSSSAYLGFIFGSPTVEEQGRYLPNGLSFVTISLEKIIQEYAFFDCQSLIDIQLPSDITEIGESAFYNCWNLEMFIIPETVDYIGRAAFQNCWQLTIYCQFTSQPQTWDDDWNISNVTLNWLE